MRAWLLAIAVAMAASQGLVAADVIDLSGSIYLSDRLHWAGAIVGGITFGIGMVFSGGCGNRNLARIGSGDLRALFVILVLGISATMTLHGLTALARVGLDSATAIDLTAQGLDSQEVPALIAAGLGRAPGAWGWIFGLLIAAGWWVTGVLAFDEFEPLPLASLTFVAPVGDSLLYLMTFTGSRISFGIAAVAGVVIGAFAVALLRGEFRLQGFADTADLLMGFGDVTALGCTIGQGITGLSTLSLGSFIAFGALIAGGVPGVQLLDRLSD